LNIDDAALARAAELTGVRGKTALVRMGLDALIARESVGRVRRISKDRLKTIITARLSLKDPQYLLERVGNRLTGKIISASFKGKRFYRWQELIWDALESELGPDSPKLVGLLLTYTPEEWNIGADEKVTTKKRKKVG